MHKDLVITMKNEKTGKHINCLLNHVPRIGDGIVPDRKTVWRVTDIIWHNHWYNSHSVYHEATVWVKKEKTK